ncbi:NACHT domain-containing protein [Hymenobacter jeongseonensis]|uniref:NACHT domain-containing protein n=1 Tax=Hymenobacter jeongseonensis TaxID=2791027 RepID=UPI0021CE0478|nr:NACHT domain-containing protein [Hymenobacter jeongseonensis]
MPDEDWLPLFLRCRTLGDRTADPVLKLLEEIAVQTSMPAQEADAFRGVVHERLRSGKVLLLIDGLDEIPDEGGRKSFANNLRTFLALFPQIAMVVTSREAGFRVVAGVIASTCQQAKLAPLQVADIRYLCEQWHVEVVRDSPQVREEAQKLANDICNNHNIFTLAQNPLLLTTLLVVKRSIGELPTNRAALYAEAVKLLVKTWNIEGFNALNEKEALAQLSYVACAMMEKNIKQIPHAELLNLLQESREVLAAELQYIRMSPEEFVEQVEYRSSLLMLSGRKMVEGELQPLYEFRHLTFQEYLAARGYVKKQHPRRTQRLSLLELLEPKFGDHTWREVIPLAAVLAELDAEPLLKG